MHEAPTLFEVGVADRYDAIVTVTAPAEVREGRRPGARRQMAHQLPEAEKAARSDYVYENTGTLEDLDRFVVGAGGAAAAMIRRVLVGLAAMAVVAGAGYAYLQHTQPDWWVRFRHPLELPDATSSATPTSTTSTRRSWRR